MATFRSKPINSKTLFFTTSPRTPFKIIPELELLVNEFGGEIWNPTTQRKFYNSLVNSDFSEAKESKTPDLSARDRINRFPKAMGFITLPIIGLSDAGKEFLESENNKEEILLRQLLKFQLPSPYHPLGKQAANYNIKPYLEILRLIYDLDGLTFDELQIFAMQLVNYELYPSIVSKIRQFRRIKQNFNGHYKELKHQTLIREVTNIYSEDITSGNIATRESKTKTVEQFIKKKISNLRDYSDAVVRHLRTTGIVNATAIGKTLTIAPDKKRDVEFILTSIDRIPIYVDNLTSYQDYLFNPCLPKLLTDDREQIVKKLQTDFGVQITDNLSLNKLKELLNKKNLERKNERIASQVHEMKSYRLYNDIDSTFDSLKDFYEPSLFLEWNTWRAMTMINGGSITANLKFDDEGSPMNTALGNKADIVCNYGEFDVTVEVTLSKGQLQYKMEGEPVPRHIGLLKQQNNNKPTYCFFIAPTINPATVAHFYTLYLTNIQMYGGKCCIIPLTIDTFRKMLKVAAESPVRPTPNNIRNLFLHSKSYVDDCIAHNRSEMDWFNMITERAANWLDDSITFHSSNMLAAEPHLPYGLNN